MRNIADGQRISRWTSAWNWTFTISAFASIGWNLSICSNVTRAKSDPTTVDLYLVAGQSNAVGFDANPAQLPIDPVDKEILFWWRCGDPPPDAYDSTSRGEWTFLQSQPRGMPMVPKEARQFGNFSNQEGGFGPEIGFARELYAREGRRIAVIKVAFSGTGMRDDWNPASSGDGGSCFRALVTETKSAMAAAKATGIALRIRALVWVQGESDANARDAANYEMAFSAMLSSLRRDLEAPDLLALLGFNTQFGDGKVPFIAKVIEAQRAIAAKDPRCRYVDTAGITLANIYHFDAEGTLEVGRRYARALLQLESQRSARESSPSRW